MNLKEEIIGVDIQEFFEENNIVVGDNGEIKGLTIDKLRELSCGFLDSVIVGEDRYIGVDGLLQHRLSILLDCAIKAQKGSKELKEANRNLREFNYYTEKYLGFEQIGGGFTDKNK